MSLHLHGDLVSRVREQWQIQSSLVKITVVLIGRIGALAISGIHISPPLVGHNISLSHFATSFLQPIKPEEKNESIFKFR
jgi:hypothetical protein